MKATKPGKVIGISLEDFDETSQVKEDGYGRVVHFIDVHWWGGEREGGRALGEILENQENKINDLEERVKRLEKKVK
jgi:hypothetical protein